LRSPSKICGFFRVLLGFPPFFRVSLELLLLLLLEAGCLQHASIPCSSYLEVFAPESQQLYTHASFLGKLGPWEAWVCPKSKWGKKYACKLRAMSAPETPKAEPRQLLRVQLGHEMTVASENDGGPLWIP